MEESVFDFTSYRDYLLSKVGPKSQRLGVKSGLARALNCQPTYVSQVLSGRSEFNLEQGEKASRFFGHVSEETQFFLLLIQHERAGTPELRKFFEAQMREQLNKRMNLTQRLGQVNPLSEEQRSRYYSSWIYATVHMAVTIAELKTAQKIAHYLGTSKNLVTKTLDFLLKAKLVEKKGDEYISTDHHIRLGSDSHLIVKHHTNWRVRAIEALDREDVSELHYSSVFSISQKDVAQIKNQLLETIKGFAEKIKGSKEEELYSMSFDLFSLQHKRE